MTTVQTRVHEIWNKEGFMVAVTRNGKPVNIHRNGTIGPWPHRNKTRETHSVSEFKEKFEATYRGYSCDVLYANGTAVHGNTRLIAVRATY
jgi:hypothetical protein